MKKRSSNASDPASLRSAAEARLQGKPRTGSPRTEADVRSLLHGLEVHQIELEMQNDELRASRKEIEAGLERYTDHYDFAPVGYVTLNRHGTILSANLTVARLLGVERSRLLRRSLIPKFTETSRSLFRTFLEQTFTSGTRETCEVELPREATTSLFVRVEAVVGSGGLECRAALMDVTDRHRAEAVRDQLIEELQQALARVKQLTGLLPICASCKNIRDSQGNWSSVEAYVTNHSEAKFSHGLCPVCVARMNGKIYE